MRKAILRKLKWLQDNASVVIHHSFRTFPMIYQDYVAFGSPIIEFFIGSTRQKASSRCTGFNIDRKSIVIWNKSDSYVCKLIVPMSAMRRSQEAWDYDLHCGPFLWRRCDS